MQPNNADGRTRVMVVDDGKSLNAEMIKTLAKELGYEPPIVDSLPVAPRPSFDIGDILMLADPTPELPTDAASQLARLPDEVPDPDLTQMPPFNIPNRSRAERVVEKLYGINSRLRFPKKANAGTVQVVLQEGAKCTVLRQAATINELLSEPVESYVKGGKDLDDVEKRIKALESPVQEFLGGRRVIHLSMTLGEMAWRACSQFPEFKVKRQREYDKYRDQLKKAIDSQQLEQLENLAANAEKQLAELE